MSELPDEELPYGCAGRHMGRKAPPPRIPGPFYASSEEQAEFLARVYVDNFPDEFDAIYGFGCHINNESSVLTEVYMLGQEFPKASPLILDRTEYVIEGDIVAYSGYDVWHFTLSQLRSLLNAAEGIDMPNGIVSVSATASGGKDYNTLLESLDVINFVNSKGWKSIAVVAFPAHLPRAFASAVTAAKHLGWGGKIYASCGTPLRWDERVTHSHGTGAISRAESVAAEHRRLEQYCVSGQPVPLLRARELLDYLNQRDSD